MSRLWDRRCLVWACMRTSSVQAQFAGAILYECNKRLPLHDVLGSAIGITLARLSAEASRRGVKKEDCDLLVCLPSDVDCTMGAIIRLAPVCLACLDFN